MWSDPAFEARFWGPAHNRKARLALRFSLCAVHRLPLMPRLWCAS